MTTARFHHIFSRIILLGIHAAYDTTVRHNSCEIVHGHITHNEAWLESDRGGFARKNHLYIFYIPN